MTQLSPHFSLAEFTTSQEAARRGLDNTPPPAVIEALKLTAQGLEAVRVRLGCAPIIVSSGYRSPVVNAAVGGSKTSQHMTGQAADIICPGFGAPAQVAAALRDSGIAYDQLILEFGRWVHISFAPKPRHMALIIDRDGTRPMWG
jgi:zinc D-Ala-D-Ala carboxypeptidase